MAKHKKNILVIKAVKELFKEKELKYTQLDEALLIEQVVVVVKSYIDTKLLMKKEKIEEHLKTEEPKEVEDTHEEN
jgi:hypothetical protein